MNPVFRSWFYRIWVFGGLVVVAGVVVAVGLSWQPGEPPPYRTFGIVLGIYLLGILTLQAIGLARSRPRSQPVTAVPVDPARPPRSAAELQDALALPDPAGTRSRRAAAGQE